MKYQKQQGPGRECVDILTRDLPESYDYLLPYLERASTNKLRLCTCTVGQGEGNVKHNTKHYENQKNENTKVKLQGQKVNVEDQKIELLNPLNCTDIGIKSTESY